MKIKNFKQLNEKHNSGIEIKKIYTDYMNMLNDITEFMRVENMISETYYAKEWWYDYDDIYFEVYVVDENDNGDVGDFHFGDKEITNFSHFLMDKKTYIDSKKYNI